MTPNHLCRAAALIVILALAACAAILAPPPAGFIHHGNFKRMMHSGDTAGTVRLASLPQLSGHWGLGATAGLKGEVIQIDGQLLVSDGADQQGRVRPAKADEQAVLFAGAKVGSWTSVAVPRDMKQADFEAFVRTQAQSLGLSLDQPFMFRVEGAFTQLVWHVVTGEGDSGHAGHGGRAGHGSPGGHARPANQGGQRAEHSASWQPRPHANQTAFLRVFDQPQAKGQLLGVYSGASLEGAISHPGERFHLHFAASDLSVSGHVDEYSVAAGAVLRLPAK